MEEVFRLADLSKFAKSKPTEDEAQSSMTAISDFADLVEQVEEEKRAKALRDAHGYAIGSVQQPCLFRPMTLHTR